MTMDPVSDIKLGLPVHTVDGEKVGEVKDLYGEYVKISAPLEPDYWVHRERVLSFTSERVTLECDKDHLDDCRMHEPEGYAERAA